MEVETGRRKLEVIKKKNRVDAREGEIARLCTATVEYGRLLRKSGGEIVVLETTVRELRDDKTGLCEGRRRTERTWCTRSRPRE